MRRVDVSDKKPTDGDLLDEDDDEKIPNNPLPAIPPGLDPAKVVQFRLDVFEQQSLPCAIAGGMGAAILGVFLWWGLAKLAAYGLGILAPGVGLMVGYAIRRFGHGIQTRYGVIGALIALFACAIGTVISADAPALTAGSILAPRGTRLMSDAMSKLDYLFVGIAVFLAYRTSFRRVTREELEWLGGDTSPDV